MQIGILGTGIVGQTLGLKFAQLGHSVMLGTRDPSKLDEPKGHGPSTRTLTDWLAEAGPTASVGLFADAAAYGDLVINAVRGAASLDVLQSVGDGLLRGKTLIDTSNAIAVERDFQTLFTTDADSLFVKDTDSVGEMLQRALPSTHVVKTLNTMLAPLMANPNLVADGDHTVFVSGNNAAAKAQVADLLREIGWRDILDLGDISTARATELYIALGLGLIRTLGPVRSALKVVRE